MDGIESAPYRHLFVHRDIDIGLDSVADVSVSGVGHGQVGAVGKRVDLWLIGDKPNGSRLRARTKQRALWPRQHLDTLNIGGVHVEVTTWRGYRLLIQIERHIWRGALCPRQQHGNRLNCHAPDVNSRPSRTHAG